MGWRENPIVRVLQSVWRLAVAIFGFAVLAAFVFVVVVMATGNGPRLFGGNTEPTTTLSPFDCERYTFRIQEADSEEELAAWENALDECIQLERLDEPP